MEPGTTPITSKSFKEAHVTLLTWNHAHGVGVQAMDDQHGILMDSISALSMAMMRGAGRERISELLDELIEFTRMHFRSEEQLMEQKGFAGLHEHRTEHHRILAEILQSAHRMRYGDAVQARPLLCGLQQAFAGHMEVMDRQYGSWLQQRGIY